MVYTMVSGSRGKGEYTIEAGARVPLWPYTMEAEPWPNVPHGVRGPGLHNLHHGGGWRPEAGSPWPTVLHRQWQTRQAP